MKLSLGLGLLGLDRVFCDRHCDFACVFPMISGVVANGSQLLRDGLSCWGRTLVGIIDDDAVGYPEA